MSRLRKGDFEVRDLPRSGEDWEAARRFITENHYAGGCSKTAVYAHGLFRKDCDKLLGVALWLPPTKVCAQSVNPLHWRKVISLSRLAVHPAVPKNAATFLMGRSIRRIRSDGRFMSLVTFADEFMGHTGAIYHAANWLYVGATKATERWEDQNGRQVAKQATRTRTTAEMVTLGYRKNGRHRKHKFVMHLQHPSNDDWGILWWAVAV